MSEHQPQAPPQPPVERDSDEPQYIDPGPNQGAPDAVVLDLGGDIGALIVYAAEDCIGMEIDLTVSGAPRSHHVHTMIRRRRLIEGDVFAGVYPDLREGTYTVWGHHGPLGDVTIRGGAVAEFHAGDCGKRPGP